MNVSGLEFQYSKLFQLLPHVYQNIFDPFERLSVKKKSGRVILLVEINLTNHIEDDKLTGC